MPLRNMPAMPYRLPYLLRSAERQVFPVSDLSITPTLLEAAHWEIIKHKLTMTKKIIFGAAMALLSLTSCYNGSNNESAASSPSFDEVLTSRKSLIIRRLRDFEPKSCRHVGYFVFFL